MARHCTTATRPDARARERGRAPSSDPSNGCHLPDVNQASDVRACSRHRVQGSRPAGQGKGSEAKPKRTRRRPEKLSRLVASSRIHGTGIDGSFTLPRPCGMRALRAPVLLLLLLRFYGRHMPQSPLLMQQWWLPVVVRGRASRRCRAQRPRARRSPGRIHFLVAPARRPVRGRRGTITNRSDGATS
jgi:hypothetical protein